VHLYENQVEIFKNEQVGREPKKQPKLVINPEIKTLKDLETWVTMDDFELIGYEHHPQIKYPFTV
jgi:thymidylate synthase